MANQEHLDLIKQGVAIWNAWKDQHPEIRADLSRANLREVNLNEANLTNANLIRADLSVADLSRANLIKANLSGADLSRAVRRESRVSHCSIGKEAKGGTCCSTSSILEWRSGKVTIRQKPIDNALQPTGWQ